MQRHLLRHSLFPLVMASGFLLTACGGDYGGGDNNSAANTDTAANLSSDTSSSSSDSSSNSSSSSSNSSNGSASNSNGSNNVDTVLRNHFAAKIDPQMSFCGTCHIPAGIADTEAGHRFLLTSASTHYDDFRQAWETLGKGVETSSLLALNSDPARAHTGGKSWPANSVVYADVKTLLLCWDQPAKCPLVTQPPDNAGNGDGSGTPTPTPNPPPPTHQDDEGENALLGSSHGKHLWNRFCETANDDALLPTDPRALIKDGISNGKAVYFNAFYEDCHVNLPDTEKAPKTCGEYKARVERGDYFANKRAGMADISVPSNAFNNLWKAWGMKQRPTNFDQLLTERYGFNPSPIHNPYPLPGEDPVATEGGSGQLPMGFIQGRDASGNYNGRISMNCYICHGGQIGSAQDGPGLGSIPGMGNTNTDMMILMRDLSRGLVGSLLPISLNSTRGTSNAVGAFDMLTLLWDVDTLSVEPNPFKLPFTHSYHGNQDMPNWWNTTHRPRKFFDGGVSTDSTRIDMAASDQLNFSKTGADRRAATELHDQDLQAYVDAQVAPNYPAHIDTALAKAGSVIFHSKDLWANGANANIKRPNGNGSCAGCHGAYSPRYTNDPDYLENPVMEGLAGYVVPLDIINTDPARAMSISPVLRKAFGSTWWGYPDGQPGYVPPDEKTPLGEFLDDIDNKYLNPANRPVKGACGWRDDVGYLAPPLFGVWASSPYFHNGSVPTLRAVLRSSERPTIWKRLDSPVDGKIKGFDMSLSAYDLDKDIGWKYTTYCSTKDTPIAECSADHRVRNNMLYQWLDTLKDNVWLLGFINKPFGTQKQIDARKIYNTHDFSNSNTGHEFTNVLTDAEVNAVIEYLKTL